MKRLTQDGKMSKKSRLRNLVFTLNNYTELEEKNLMDRPEFKYLIYQHEVGKDGTKHLQGYAELKRQIAFNKIKKFICFKRAYIDRRRYSQQACIAYCSKDDTREKGTSFIEKGTPNRNAISKTLAEYVKDGASKSEIIEKYPTEYLKLHSGIDKMREIIQTRRDFKPQVIILFGLTGTGKSYYANKKWPEAYRGEWPQGGRWWLPLRS